MQAINAKLTLLFALLCFMASCDFEPATEADTIYYNGVIYTMDMQQPNVEAVAVKADTILAVGAREAVEEYAGATTKWVDLQQQTMIPGFVEGHAHILGVGYNLLNVDLRNATSYQEVIDMVTERAKMVPEGTWILGRGWHQEKWIEQPEMVRGFPTHDRLSEATPNHPVYLTHVSSHAALANEKAMEVAGIDRNTPQPEGGEIFRGLGNRPTGMFNETAQALIRNAVPENTRESDAQALNLALEECFRHGITSLHQAGSGAEHIQLFKDFAAKDALKLRLYVMLSGREEDLLLDYFEKGIEEDLYDNQLTIRSVKLYADGALGSRGAWLLEEYSDAPGVHGHNVVPMEKIKELTEKAHEAGFQVCVHAIGDRANREVLDIYEGVFERYPDAPQKEPRFRIEHAQHFHPDDIPRLAQLGVVPAMQAIHMSSDRPWAIHRLGRKRINWGAYMWQTLLKSGARIVNGTDAPVEPISPIASFYAAVSRKTLRGTPKGGYEPAERMTREQALRSYTLDAAYGAFREHKKGSIEVGKWADFTVLDKDIMSVPEEDILETKVTMTIIGGEVVYELSE